MDNNIDPLPIIDMHPEVPKRHPIVLFVTIILLVIGAIVFVVVYMHRAKPVAVEQPVPIVADVVITDKAALANFSYLGKPIHPNCISESANDEGEADQYDPKIVPSSTPINLATCSTPTGGSYDESSLEYDFPDDENGSPGGFVRYNPIIQKGTLFVLQATSNGGGSGVFDDVEVIEKTGDTIRNLGYINAIQTGDRCNGGINSISANKDGSIEYSVNLTPYDLIVLGDPQTKLEAYSDLEASAASCVAFAGYRYDLDTNVSRPTVVSIDSVFGSTDRNTGKIVDEKGWTEKYTYQSCFNKVYNSYVDDNKITLDQTGVTQFAADFVKSCIKK